MDVFLIPVAAIATSCTASCRTTILAIQPEGRGWFRNLVAPVPQALAEAERARQHPPSEPPAVERSWYNRIKGLTLRRIAESVAEQRLLWHMRRARRAVAVHPADVAAEEALRVVRASMQSDFEKHRYWVVVDARAVHPRGTAGAAAGPERGRVLLGFRLVGHYLSMRGARQALDSVQWTTSRERAARGAAPRDRARTRRARGARQRHRGRLQLERLASFFLRTAVPSA